MAQQLYALMIEDEENDALLLARLLRLGGYELNYERVDTAEAMLVALEQGQWDVIIADYSMPHFSGMAALALIQERGIDLPFIMISGKMGEETAVEAMKAGAHDYLIKDNLERLIPAIERELREAEERQARRLAEEQVHTLSRALAQSASLVMITDPNGVVEYINDAFSHVTGFEANDVVGQQAAFLNGTVPQKYPALIAAYEAGVDWRGELQSTKKNGESYWAALTLSPVHDQQGAISHFLMIQEDITERKRLEAELQRYTGQLEAMVEERTVDLEQARDEALETLRLKTQIMTNMRHEARTPVSIITLKTELLARGRFGPATSKQQEAFEIIRAEALSLLRHFENLVDQSQLDSNTLSLEKTRFQPDQLVAAVANALQSQAENKGLALTAEIDDNVPGDLYGSADRLKRVLVNLVDNAIRFTDEGMVQLRIFQPDSEHWALQVSDTGPGIPPDARETIFEPFGQVDGSTTRLVSRGVGLGLSVVQQSTALMGGTIDVDSDGITGTTFTVILPIEHEIQA